MHLDGEGLMGDTSADFWTPLLAIGGGAGLFLSAEALPGPEKAQMRLVMKGGGLVLAGVGVYLLLKALGTDISGLGLGKNPTGHTTGESTPAAPGDAAQSHGGVGAQFLEPASGANVDREGRLFGLFGDTVQATVRVTNGGLSPSTVHLAVDALLSFSDGSTVSTQTDGGTFEVAAGHSRDTVLHVPLGTSAFEVINPFSPPSCLLTATLDGTEAAQIGVTIA